MSAISTAQARIILKFVASLGIADYHSNTFMTPIAPDEVSAMPLNSKDNAAPRGNDAAMAASADVVKPLRVLVSDGSSTSAREAVTILGLSGHHVEVCDPSRYCLARFSRF